MVKAILVTGATGFLGYHVAKRLNDIGFRPRVLEAPDSRLEVLDGLDVDRCSGHLDDLTAVSAACGELELCPAPVPQAPSPPIADEVVAPPPPPSPPIDETATSARVRVN